MQRTERRLPQDHSKSPILFSPSAEAENNGGLSNGDLSKSELRCMTVAKELEKLVSGGFFGKQQL